MRILMVSEDLPAPGMGGLARHVLALSRALIALGHQVDLMGNDDYPPQVAEEKLDIHASCGKFFAELHGQFEGWKEMPLGIFMPPKRTLIAKRFALAILKRAKHYDVIHYHGHLPNIASHLPPTVNFIQTRHDQGSDCLIHTRFARGKICTRTDPLDCAGCRNWNPNFLQRQLSALTVRRFRHEVMTGFSRHKTVFVSELLQQNLQRSFGVRPWGVTLHNFIDTKALQEARAAVMPPSLSGPVQVFIAAKLYSAKGVSALLKALARCEHAGLHISVAGDGSDETSLRASFPWVTFHGWQSGEQTLKLAAQAHLIVVPSICEEACASTVLEGLMLGKTVFALRLGGTPELVIYQSKVGQLQLFNDMNALVQAMLSFEPHKDIAIAPEVKADARHAAHSLIQWYQLPAGPIAS